MENTNTMQPVTALYNQLRQPSGFAAKLKSWATASQNKTISSWAIEQLRIQPYQHILEIGYGNGSTLNEAAKKLSIGFIAGIDESVDSYQQAYKKNKRFIEQELMQLHIGPVKSIPYPAHYFHSIYSTNIYSSWKEPQYKFMQLGNLLKSGGKLITLFHPQSWITEKEMWDAAEKIQEEYIDAGLTDVRLSFREIHSTTCIAAVGYKD
jgi:cyclopropane fatty-acyl-phospholipid synthase-like methyltransferase